MKWFAYIFLLSLLPGQLGWMPVVGTAAIYFHDIALVVLCVASFVRIVRTGRVKMPLLARPILLVLCAGVVSLAANVFRFSWPEVGVSSLYLVRFALYCLLYITVVGEDRIHTQVWIYGLYIVGTVFSVFGFIQLATFPNLRSIELLGWDPHNYRLVSTLFDPNFAGMVIALTILLGLGVFRKHDRWFYISESINVVALILTFSRSSWLAFIGGVLVYAVFTTKKPLWVMGVLLFCIVVVVLPKPGGDTLRLDRFDSTVSRIRNWTQSFDLFLTSPVVGYGFNTLRIVAIQKGIFAHNSIATPRSGAGIDNSLLFILASMGVVGAIAFSTLFHQVLRLIHRARRDEKLRNATYALCIAVWVHSMFSNSLFYPWVLLPLFIIIGVIERTGSNA